MPKESAVPERRRYCRVPCRMRGAVGATGVMIIDLSMGGIGVVHEAALPAPGGVCRLEVPSEIGPIRLDCAIVRTVKRNAADAARALFHTGLQVLATDRQSEERLRSIAESKN
ncbi:MAG TPA: PilZ domain-containing protein [Thermoanaerobaculia bacterium]|nr:PilZ domain-containing protein [Thermoanaerobaculia bacterium]